MEEICSQVIHTDAGLLLAASGWRLETAQNRDKKKSEFYF
jgi:hypothetical protein